MATKQKIKTVLTCVSVSCLLIGGGAASADEIVIEIPPIMTSDKDPEPIQLV